MKTKLYFESEDHEICCTKEYFQQHMKDEGLTEMEVFEAIPDSIPNIFYCKELMFCGDTSEDSCGFQCKDYKPRNGKSGCCKHYTKKLYEHGEKVTITL